MESDLISRRAVLKILSDEFDMAAEERAEADNEKDRAFNAGEIHCARRSTRKVNELPAVDAVPVVRCKDCIHAVAITNLTIANRCGLGQKNCMRQRGDDGFGFTGVSVVYPDGFCDEGARMDAKEDT